MKSATLQSVRTCLLSLGLLAALPAGAQVSGSPDCDDDCLRNLAAQYMEALVAQDESLVPWSQPVHFTEDQVSMMIGDALWGSITAYGEAATVVTDPASGEVAWFGWVEEHDLPAYYGMRLKVRDQAISGVETVVARLEEPGHFSEEVKERAVFSDLEETLPEDSRSSRERMVDIAHGFYSTLQQNDGTLFTDFADGCSWHENGVDVTTTVEGFSGDCKALLELGYYRPLNQVRERRFHVVDEARGLVMATATRDRLNDRQTWTTNDGRERQIDDVIYFPHSRGTMDLIRIEDGRITDIRTLSNFLPYGMPSPWQARALRKGLAEGRDQQ